MIGHDLLDETVEMLLDTHSAVTATLADEMPLFDLEELLRELTAEIVDVYRTVTEPDHQNYDGSEDVGVER